VTESHVVVGVHWTAAMQGACCI